MARTAASYDPQSRRPTPLALAFRQRIAESGPLLLADYVRACLTDPAHGYYVGQPAIGRTADFTTAPEISQVFGELIGLWCAIIWQHMGRPPRLNLVELGPGRGTLMADALRAIAKVTDLQPALSVHLVDTNAHLRQLQTATLATAGVPLTHYETIADFSARATNQPGAWLVLGNEFLDAIGVSQHIVHKGTWHDRTVDIDTEGRLQFAIGPPVQPPANLPAPAADATVFEFNPELAEKVAPLLAALAAQAPTAALFIDYGHLATTAGETLQALRAHAYENPLTSPGEADLTAHVDFADVTHRMQAVGLHTDGPLTQAEFLGRLGIIERTSRLMSANPAAAAALEASSQRLLAPNGMGTRFKAIGVRSPGLAPLPPFAL